MGCISCSECLFTEMQPVIDLTLPPIKEVPPLVKPEDFNLLEHLQKLALDLEQLHTTRAGKMKARFLLIAFLAGFIITLPTLAEDAAKADLQPGYFGSLQSEATALLAFNLEYVDGLSAGYANLANSLSQLSSSGTMDVSQLEQMRKRLLEDYTTLSNQEGALFKAIVKWLVTAEQEVRRMRSMLKNNPDADLQKNLSLMELEMTIVQKHQKASALHAGRVDKLSSQLLNWQLMWKSTERITGIDSARQQVQPLIKEEAEKWHGFLRMELVSALANRNFGIPEETPARLRQRFLEVLTQVPRLSGAISVSPETIRPLAPDPPGQVSFEMQTTLPGKVQMRIRDKDEQVIELPVEKLDERRYKATWQPDFISDTQWRSKLRKQRSVSLGEWQLDWEIKTELLLPDKSYVTPKGSVAIAVSASAPKGVALSKLPEKPYILQYYQSEENIPLKNKYHFFSFVAYPIFGLPRDLVDTVFGIIDKVPYVSIPVSFVYAAPGQLLFKPWWDEEYTPFSEQSAGFLSLEEWKNGGEWEFFENSRTWYWPKNPFGVFAMFNFYMVLGFPRDVLDVPFGCIDQIPYLGMPISYVYQPVTLLTKPWYCDHYTTGKKKGMPRTPYRDQSKNVIGLTEWWEHSNWVFFENFHTTTFRSPNVKKRERIKSDYRKAEKQYRLVMESYYKENQEIRDTFVVTLEVKP